MSGRPFAASPLAPSEPIREGWSWYRLTALARLATGHTPSRRRQEYWSGEIPWIQLPDIRVLDGHIAQDTLECVSLRGIDNSAAVILPEGTVCLSRTASLGFVTVMGRPMATSQDFVNWVCGPQLAPRFLMYLLIACREEIRRLGSGAVHHTIYFNTVETFCVCVPPVADQYRYVAHIERAMELGGAISQAGRERLAAAEALSMAALSAVFDGPNVRDLPTIAVGDFADTCSGATPPRAESSYFGGGIPWVKTGELKDGLVGVGGTTEETVTDRALRECSLPLLPVGTLLVAMYGQGQTRGRTGLLACEATTNQACFAILPKPDVYSSEFLQLWFRANYQRLRALTEHRGGNQPNLNGVLLRRVRVPLPPLSEQRRIAVRLSARLAAAETLLQKCAEEFLAIQALPASFLRAIF